MTNKSNLKTVVTKLKNRIINSLHSTDIPTLIKIAELLKIRISPELKNFKEEE